MVTCHATKAGVFELGTTATIDWSFTDDNTGDIVDPTSESAKLFDPNDAQWDPTDTSVSTAATFAPTEDTDGSVTGTVGKFYASIDLDAASATGTWYVEVTYTYENVTRVRNICFQVVAAGADVSGDTAAGTITSYIVPSDVKNFLLLQSAIDQNSALSEEAVEQFIIHAEGEFERRSRTAYRPVYVTDEMHDIEATKSRYREIFDDDWFSVPRPLHLEHYPVLPFNSARGHKIELYEGSESSSTDGTLDWTDYITTKTQGRQNDWWLDQEQGILHVRKTFLFRRNALFRITYEYGKPITTTTSSVSATASTINVASTYRYAARGVARIGREYIFHTGKTNTSLTGCTRGLFGTTAVSHASGAEVYEVPDDVRSIMTKYVAAQVLQNEVYTAIVGDGGDSSPPVAEKVRKWTEEWNLYLDNNYSAWSVF